MQLKRRRFSRQDHKNPENKLLVDATVEGTLVNASVQVDEDSLPGLIVNESDLSGDEDTPSR